jgi:hypothetical protein
MSLNGGNAAGPPYPAIHVANGDSPIITFTIQNAPGVSFTNNSFLVPAEAKGIHVQSVQPTELKVHDKNLAKGDIPYVIAFDGPAAKLDPIIQNDGGGRIAPTLSTYDTTTVAIGAFVIGVIVTLVVRAMFRKRNV